MGVDFDEDQRIVCIFNDLPDVSIRNQTVSRTEFVFPLQALLQPLFQLVLAQSPAVHDKDYRLADSTQEKSNADQEDYIWTHATPLLTILAAAAANRTLSGFQ